MEQEDPDKAALDKRLQEITDQISKLDVRNPAQFRAKQLLEYHRDTVSELKRNSFRRSTKSAEDSVVEKKGVKTCKDLDTDESLRIKEEGARKKKRGCLEHINEQQRRLGELKGKMEMEEETRKRVQEVHKTIMEMRSTMQFAINKIAEETRTELALISKKLEHHDKDLAMRKEIHTRFRKEQQANGGTWTARCLSAITKLLWYFLFIVALIRDKCIRPTKAYFPSERMDSSAETSKDGNSKEGINSKESNNSTETTTTEETKK
ncbi:hypothetical protein PMAYCL1PPCAC_28566, partial [Pristionchus mayeri]